ncbi:MAG: hypothetical protein ACK417_08840 [Bacteroidia bacterium]
MPELLLHGFGGHGQVVQTALPPDWKIVGFFDKQLPHDWAGDIPYLGVYDPTVLPEFPLLITIGDNALRESLVAKAGHSFANCISPEAFCAPKVPIGEGTVILQQAVVQARASIGRHVIVNAGAVVDHDAEVGDFVHIGPGAVVASLSKIGNSCFIGAGAIIPSRCMVPDGTILPPGMVYQPFT